MCNLYDVGPGKARNEGWIADAIAELSRLSKQYALRKTDTGLVVTSDLKPRLMRWGFHRGFNPAINNSRTEKLESGMWAAAHRDRRCLVPASSFYVWTGPTGRKQTHSFTSPDDDWLWIAGLWEEHVDLGPCYSMITTAANEQVAAIHHRMPAILPLDRAIRYLSDPGCHPTPTGESLIIANCPSPLKPPGPEQGELF